MQEGGLTDKAAWTDDNISISNDHSPGKNLAAGYLQPILKRDRCVQLFLCGAVTAGIQ